MSKAGNIIKGVVVFLLLGTALGLVSYPFISNYVFENRTDSIVETIEQSAEEITDVEKQAAIEDAEKYNDIISNGHVELKDPFVDEELDDTAGDYHSLLCMTDDGVMGFVKIPSIDVSLPIYHGTSETVLEIGAGHLQGTSLPIGGESTHTVLTGHTGLSNAKLFTDLTELEEGDIFFLTVMGEKLAYKVDQIRVVEPTDTSDLRVEPGKDYCTLLTCTPYGVNSHRLLVRGVRTDYQEVAENPEVFEVKKTESKWMAEYKRAVLISLGFFAASVMLLSLKRQFGKKENRKIMDNFC